MTINQEIQSKQNQYSNLSLADRLKDFRKQSTLQSMSIAEHEWTYYAVGNPENEALLLLHGGGADAEAMFAYILHFSEFFYVIAPNIPSSHSDLNEVVTGLRALLTQLTIDRTVVVAVSFGAMLAQMYIRKFQDSVIDMVITHSLIPSKHLAEITKTQQKLLQFYPEPILLWLSKRSYRQHIAHSTTPASEDVRQFWQDYFDDLYSRRIRKKQIVSRARLMAVYHRDNEFNSRDLLNWQGNLLIIESEDDDVIADGDRGSLKAMYSRAYIQTLDSYDHLAPFLAADELISSITNFLLKED